MKNVLIKFLYQIIDCFPESCRVKIKIILNVLFHDWRFFPVMVPGWDYFSTITALQKKSLEDHFDGVDDCSLAILKRFIAVQTLYYVPQVNYHCCFYSMNGLYTKSEYRACKRLYRKEMSEKRKFGFKRKSDYLSSLIYHHGLRDLSEAQKERLRGTAFIDAGAFIGDSSLGMLQYNPEKIYAFDPSMKNCDEYRMMMKKNHIPDERYALIAAGLGAENKKITNFNDTGEANTSVIDNEGTETIDIVSLDSFWSDKNEPIGFIKADVEGAGFELIQGAEQVIRKYLPVLSIAVYHNEIEFFGVYELIKSWNLPYRIEFKKLSYCWENTELVLIATPEC